MNPPAKADTPELPPKLLNMPPVLSSLAKAVAKGAVEAGAAAFPKAGKSEVGCGAALPKAPVNVPPVEADGAPWAPNIEAVCEKGDAAAGVAEGAIIKLLLAPNKVAEPREDVRDPTPRDDDCELDGARDAPKMLAVVVGCEDGRVVAPNMFDEEEAAGAVDAVTSDGAEGKSRAG